MVSCRSRQGSPPASQSNRVVLIRISRGEHGTWIHRYAAHLNFEMQVESGRAPTRPFKANRLSSDHLCAVGSRKCLEVTIEIRRATGIKFPVSTETSEVARWEDTCDVRSVHLMEDTSGDRYHDGRRGADDVDAGVRVLPWRVTESLTHVEAWTVHRRSDFRAGERSARRFDTRCADGAPTDPNQRGGPGNQGTGKRYRNHGDDDDTRNASKA
jgi:hypothetical protein